MECRILVKVVYDKGSVSLVEQRITLGGLESGDVVLNIVPNGIFFLEGIPYWAKERDMFKGKDRITVIAPTRITVKDCELSYLSLKRKYMRVMSDVLVPDSIGWWPLDAERARQCLFCEVEDPDKIPHGILDVLRNRILRQYAAL